MVSPQVKIAMHLKVGLRSFVARRVPRCSVVVVAEMNEDKLMEVISKVLTGGVRENTVAKLLTDCDWGQGSTA